VLGSPPAAELFGAKAILREQMERVAYVPEKAGIDWSNVQDVALSLLMITPPKGDTVVLTDAAKYCPFHVTS
jgi:hypothetical protein